MWNTIANNIAEKVNRQFAIENKSPITGGDINLSFLIEGDNQRYFVKINQKSFFENFEAEAYSLRLIRQSEHIAAPEVILVGQTKENAYLVMEYLAFQEPTEASWLAFGEQLAFMHKTTTHGQFGWSHDNVIGSTPQPNRWSSNWRQFFAEQRIGWQLQLLSEKSIRLGDIDYISQVCHDQLTHHQVKPCLIHGDLWQGNVGFIKKTPFIFDPASYYGDREADLAMTELFGRFPTAFYQGYNNVYPLPERYEIRKHIYNFYHVLNHATLFGGIYIDQAKACLQRILSFEHP